jgi:hypothetical protein
MSLFAKQRIGLFSAGACLGGLLAASLLTGACASSEQSATRETRRTVEVGDQRLETRLLFADTFDDLDAWTTLGDGSVWTLRDGQLVGRWGREGSSTLWSKESFAGDVLITFDGKVLSPDQAWVTEDLPEGGKNLNPHFMVTGPEGGDILEVYPKLRASGTGPNAAGFDQYHGYVLTWTRHHARLRRSPGYEKVQGNLNFLPQLNTSYHFRLLRQGDRLRYWINDILIFDYTDPALG